MARIALDHVSKVYADGTPAVSDLSIDVMDGEFLVLVGPSGCGKTTALRMVAGLESISSGELRIGDKVMNSVPPRDRDIAMVFQSYALYPHLSVRDNIGFGLQLRRVSKAELRKRVDEAAAVLGLTEYLDRKPRNLSGGQRQRVAMGRAIVRNPQAFLMDEPLSNLDAKLRVQMRAEIGKLQRDLGVTTLYVTHDQTEAMTLGSRVAVMRKGVLQQIAPPQELYDCPVNVFVAGFIGSPAMNFLSAMLRRTDGGLVLEIGPNRLRVPESLTAERPAVAGHVDKPVIVGIRPEELSEATAGAPDVLDATVELVEPLGSDVMAHLSVDAPSVSGVDDLAELAEDAVDALPADRAGTSVVARFTARSRVTVGDRVQIAVDTDRIHLFDADTGAAVWD